jgi:hypothetical protein
MTTFPTYSGSISPFRAWVQTVIPLQYDDSLSYYELLLKVVDKLNANGDTTNEVISQLNTMIDWMNKNGVPDQVDKIMDQWLTDGTISNLINSDMYTGYNINTDEPSFFTSLNFPNSNPAYGPIMQGFYITQDAETIYANVSNYPNNSGGYPVNDNQSFILYRMDATGNVLDSMTLLGIDHGTVLAMEEQGQNVFFWTMIQSGQSGKTLGRFQYAAGTTLTNDQIPLYSSFGAFESVYPTLDGEYLYLARDTGGAWKIEKRLLSDVKTGVNALLDSIVLPTGLHWLQGFANDGDNLYWLTGDAYEVGAYAQLLTEFNWTTKQQTNQIDLSFCPVEGSRKEPEGLFLYKDHKTGSKSLFIGIATNDYIQKNNKVFGIHSVLNFRKFTGIKMEDIPRDINNYQHGLITGFDGRQLITVNSGESIASKLASFQGLATVYVASGATDSPDSASSGRVLANLSSYGTGYLEWIDYQGRMWYVSMANGVFQTYSGRDTWQRVMTYDLLETPWQTQELKNGASVSWSYPLAARRINNRIQLRGCVAGSGSIVVATLPLSLQTNNQIRKTCAGDGSSTALARVTLGTNGDITVDFNGLTAVWLDMEFDANSI